MAVNGDLSHMAHPAAATWPENPVRISRAETVVAEIEALVGTHKFDYTEWDTGVSKCRHADHRAGYSASCSRAWLRDSLPNLFEEGET